MERVFQLIESMGYSRHGGDWLRRRRGWVIAMLAVCAWLVVLGLAVGLVQLGHEVLSLLVR